MKTYKPSLVLACVAILWSRGPANYAQDQGPWLESPSQHASSIEQRILDLDQYVAKAQQDWQVPGLAIAVVQNDKVLLSKGYGLKRVGTSDPVDQDTLFAIASNSKAFTAAAIAILVDEQKLAWDDQVSKYLPWFKLQDEVATKEMRIRDLLCHRSGLGTFSGDLLWWGTEYQPREILERAYHLEPASSFRSNFGYSNLMFLAAGEIVSTVSGKPWTQFVRERILDPLEMNRTICSVRDLTSQDNFATPHKTTHDQSIPIPWMNWDAMAAAGGIISSANDMSHWLRLQLRNGQLNASQRIFSEGVGHEMWQSHTPLRLPLAPSTRFPSVHFRAYGLGWSLSDYQGRKVVGHAGGYDGMNSNVLLVPEEQLGVVVLTNSLTPISNLLTYRAVDTIMGTAVKDFSQDVLEEFRKSSSEFQDRITKVTTPVAEGTMPSHPLTDFVGKYRCPMYGDATVSVENDTIVLRLHPFKMLVADLKHLHYDTFSIRWRTEFAWFNSGTAHFVADSRGKFQRIELDVPNDDLFFHEIKLTRVEQARGPAHSN
jgi:CubicO group peptidase (beta-lactamase class C family)